MAGPCNVLTLRWLARTLANRTEFLNRSLWPGRNPRLIRVVASAVLFGLAISGGSAHAVVTYIFNNTGVDGSEPFAAAGIGAFQTLTDTNSGIDITLTTEDIIGQDGSLASDGVNLHTTNAFGNNGLGINDFSDLDESGPPDANYSNENRNFNPGEAWVISFDVDVILSEIDLGSQGAGGRFTISSSAFADFVLDDGAGGDVHNLGNTLVPASTLITFAMSNVSELGNDTSIRIDSLTVGAPFPNVVSVQSGNLNDGTTWETGEPPMSGIVYNILDTHTVTATSSSFDGSGVVVRSGGTLDLVADSVEIPQIEVQEGGMLIGDTPGDFGVGVFGANPLVNLILDGSASFTASAGADLFLDVNITGTGDLDFASNGAGSELFLTAAGGHEGTIRFNGTGDNVILESTESFGTLEMNSTGLNRVIYEPDAQLGNGVLIFNQPGSLQHAEDTGTFRLHGPDTIVANAAVTVDLSIAPVVNERRFLIDQGLSGSADITVNGTATDPTSGDITHNEFEIGNTGEPNSVDVDDYSGTLTANNFVDLEVRRSLPDARIVINNNSRLEMGHNVTLANTRVELGEVEINTGGTLVVGFEEDGLHNAYQVKLTSEGERSGDLTLASGSTTVMQINGTAEGEFDSILAQGDVSLGGTLQVLVNPDGADAANPVYSPTEGDTFDLVVIDSTSPPGDYDGGGDVGPEDYDIWRSAFGTADAAADGNGDGTVDAADYAFWRNRLGDTGAAEGMITGTWLLSVSDPGGVLSSAGLALELNITSSLVQLEVVSAIPAASVATPEPNTATLAMLLSAFVLAGRRVVRVV